MAKLVVALCAVLVAPAVNSYVLSELRGTAGQRVAESTQVSLQKGFKDPPIFLLGPDFPFNVKKNGTAVRINDNPGTELEDEVGRTIGNISNRQTDVLSRRGAKFLTSSGKPGKEGPKGMAGNPGKSGPPGNEGKPGNTAAGDQGAAGPKGVRGGVGPRGPIGTAGVPGAQGDVGSIGLKGDKGDPGPVGPTGEMGEKGDS